MKRSLKRKLAGALAVLMAFFVLTNNQTMILATENQNTGISIGLQGTTTPSYDENGVFIFDGGTVMVSFDNTQDVGAVTEGNNELEIVVPTEVNTITLTFTPYEGYTPQVSTGGTNQDLTQTGSSYTLTKKVSDIEGNHISFWISFNADQPGNPENLGNPEKPEDPVDTASFPWLLDLKVGDKSISNVQAGGSYEVNDLDDLNSIEVVKQSSDNGSNWKDINGVMSTNNKDSEGRPVLEVQKTITDSNSVYVNLEAHYSDVTDKNYSYDPADNFYIVGVTFYVSDYVGVVVEQQGSVPDMFNETTFSKQLDLATSTLENPNEITQYYANDTFSLSGLGSGDATVKSIEIADATKPNAVAINGNTVTFKSNFYDSVTFKVAMSDGTTGYIKVEREGLVIDQDGINGPIKNMVYHGSQVGVDWSGTEYANKANIVGTFYYDASESYKDYHVIATLTYADGSVETKEVTGIGETLCVDKTLKGGDYILYSGTKENAPVKVSATVVPANATTGSTFGGACYGNGAGVTYIVK